MSTIIGFIALFVSLVSLWIVSETAKKISSQNESFIKAHIKGLRDSLEETRKSLSESNKKLAQLSVRIDDIEGDVQHFRTAKDNARKTLAKLDKGPSTADAAPRPSAAVRRDTG